MTRLLCLLGMVALVSGCGDSGGFSYVSPDPPVNSRKGPSLVAVLPDRAGSSLYAVADAGSVFVSRSRGVSWERVTRGHPRAPNLLAIDPDRRSVMFGEYYGRPARTIDAGKHWTLERLPRSSFADRFVVARRNSRIVYTGGFGGVATGGPPGGIYRSDDGGVTWRKIAHYEPNGLVLDPSDPETIYVRRSTVSTSPATAASTGTNCSRVFLDLMGNRSGSVCSPSRPQHPTRCTSMVQLERSSSAITIILAEVCT
jgi:hypothetical protein